MNLLTFYVNKWSRVDTLEPKFNGDSESLLSQSTEKELFVLSNLPPTILAEAFSAILKWFSGDVLAEQQHKQTKNVAYNWANDIFYQKNTYI